MFVTSSIKLTTVLYETLTMNSLVLFITGTKWHCLEIVLFNKTDQHEYIQVLANLIFKL